jgi:hypothetical protein
MLGRLTGLCIALAIFGRNIKSLAPAFGISDGLGALILFVLLVLAFFSDTVPKLVERRRLSLLKQVTGLGRPGYFQLAPREDEESFQRADEKHEEVLTWLRNPPSRLLYLTGTSGAGKSSLLAAWVIPKLRRGGTKVIRLRGFQDPASVLRTELAQLIDQPTLATDPATTLDEILEVVELNIDSHKILIVFDQFEEFLILNQGHSRDSFLEFLKSQAAIPPTKASILLVFRSDYDGFIQKLRLPLPSTGINYQRVSVFTEVAARDFLLGSGLRFDPKLQADVLREAAEVEGTLGLIRPVTVNLCGLVLSRFASGLPRQFRPGRMIRTFVNESIFHREIGDTSRQLLPKLISANATKVPRTVAELAKETGLLPEQVQGVLFRLGDSDRAIVRSVDSSQTTWEISHDFLVPIIDSELNQWKSPKWRETLEWIPTAVGVLLVALVSLVPRMLPDPVTDLGLHGWGVQPSVSQTASGGAPAVSYSLMCAGCSPSELRRSLWDLRRIPGAIDVNLANIQSFDLDHYRGWASLRNLRSLSISGADGKLVDISAVSRIPELTSLTIATGSGIPAAQLSTLPATLQVLNLQWTAVTDEMISNLPRDLDNLTVNMAPFKDSAVRGLPPKLAFLSLADTLVTDNGIHDLPRGLISLNLDDNPAITNASMKDVPRSLQALDLSGTSVTDDGLKPLPETLTSMDLSGTGVTDACIKLLPKNLHSVDLSRTKVTADGLKKLPPTVKLDTFRPLPPTGLRVFSR